MKVAFNRYMIYLFFLFAIKQLLLKIKSEVVILEKVKLSSIAISIFTI